MRQECSICYDEHVERDMVNLKCQHTFCKTCLATWINNIENRPLKHGYIECLSQPQDLMCCPICKREYFKTYYDNILLPNTKGYDYKSIICKVHFKNNTTWASIEPMQIFTFTCKNHIHKQDGLILYDAQWFKRMRIIVSLLVQIYESTQYQESLNLWVYKDGVDSITLKTKINRTQELITSGEFFNNLAADCILIDEFIDKANLLAETKHDTGVMFYDQSQE